MCLYISLVVAIFPVSTDVHFGGLFVIPFLCFSSPQANAKLRFLKLAINSLLPIFDIEFLWSSMHVVAVRTASVLLIPICYLSGIDC